jgi:hypothetical protein
MELQDEERSEIVNYLDFDRHLIGQRNQEMLQEVRALRLEERLRANRRPPSQLSPTNTLARRSVLSLLGWARLSR